MNLHLTLVPLLAAPALAQSWDVQPLALAGDVVPGVGSQTFAYELAIHDALDWRVVVDTDGPFSANAALIGPAGVIQAEAWPVSAPAGATTKSFQSLSINAHGQTATIQTLYGTSSTADDSAVYLDGQLLVREGDLTGAPGYPAGTTYHTLYEVKVDDAGDVLLLAGMDDPSNPGLPDHALIRLGTSAAGTLASEAAVWVEGSLVPASGGDLQGLLTDSDSFDLGDAGDVIAVLDTDLPTTGDDMVVLNGAILAWQGAASPVAGRSWSTLLGAEVTVNNAGGHAYDGVLDGDASTNQVIVKDGLVFAQKGAPTPGLPASLLEGFGHGPLDLADTGELLWYGTFGGATSNQDEALFLDDVPIVREGVTTVGGVVVDVLYGSTNGYAISDDGRFVIFQAILKDNTSGIFLAMRPAAAVTVPGCGAFEGSLSVSSGAPAQGTSMQLTYDHPLLLTGARQLGVSGVSWVDSSGCGVVVPVVVGAHIEAELGDRATAQWLADQLTDESAVIR